MTVLSMHISPSSLQIAAYTLYVANLTNFFLSMFLGQWCDIFWIDEQRIDAKMKHFSNYVGFFNPNYLMSEQIEAETMATIAILYLYNQYSTGQ